MQHRWTAVVGTVSIVLAAGGAGMRAAAGIDPAPRPGDVEPSAVSAYEPIEPCRVLDTRSTGARPAAREVVEVALDSCAPPPGTLAVSVTVTAVHPSGPGYATAFPTGTTRPIASLVNWSGSGSVVANSGMIPVADGSLSVYVHAAVDLVVDVGGYFVEASAGKAAAGRFVALTLPTRILDTRLTERPPAGATVPVAVPHVAVPADATAVLVNVTATESTGASFVTAWSAGPRPLASILNLDAAGQTRAATSIVGVADGSFRLFTRGGDHLIVDLVGYFTGPGAEWSHDGMFVPLAPTRQLDTRSSGPIYAEGTVEARVSGAVFVGNVTITETTRAGYLRVLPARVGTSPTSSVNADRRGGTSANLVVAPVSDKGLSVWSRHQADAVLDQTGYFTGPLARATLPADLNVPPPEPFYPSAACADLDSRLDYDRQQGAPAAREVRRIGSSVEGRPIWAEYYGPYDARAVVLVVAAVHGDECGPALAIDAARHVGAASARVGYWLVPVLNPDALATFARYNAAGVDINRDGYRASQPETQALLAFTAEVRPTLTLHVHSPYGFVGGYGDDPRAYELAAGMAWLTGMTRAVTAGTKPGDEFLWEGQMLIHPHAAILVELFPVLVKEATVDRPRIPPRPVAEVADDARQVMTLIDSYLGS